MALIIDAEVYYRLTIAYQCDQNTSISAIPSIRGAASEQWNMRSVVEPADEEGVGTIDIADVYTVKGQTYLVGKAHENKICRGLRCEIFIEVSRSN